MVWKHETPLPCKTGAFCLRCLEDAQSNGVAGCLAISALDQTRSPIVATTGVASAGLSASGISTTLTFVFAARFAQGTVGFVFVLSRGVISGPLESSFLPSLLVNLQRGDSFCFRRVSLRKPSAIDALLFPVIPAAPHYTAGEQAGPGNDTRKRHPETSDVAALAEPPALHLPPGGFPPKIIQASGGPPPQV